MGNFNLDLILSQAKSFHKKGMTEDAVNLYNKILNVFPNNHRAKTELEIANNSIEKHKSTIPPYLLNQLIEMYNQGKLKEMSDKAEILAKEFSLDFSIWNMLGAANLGLKEFKKAEIAFTTAIDLKPKEHFAHNNLGISLKNQDRIEPALESFNKAIYYKPDFFEAYFNIATLLQKQKKYEEAIKLYKKVILYKPDLFDAYNNIGNILFDQGKLQQALDIYKKAISFKPNNSEIHYNIGNIYRSQNKLNDAIKSYNKSILINPNNFKAHNNLGIILQDLSKFESAFKSFKTAILINPDYAEAFNNISLTLRDQNKLGESIKNSQQAIALNPKYSNAYNNLAATYQKEGKLLKAIENFNKAVLYKSDYADAFINLNHLLVQCWVDINNYFENKKTIKEKLIPLLKTNPKYQIIKAISFFLKNDVIGTKKHLEHYFKLVDTGLTKDMNELEKKFCNTYALFLKKLILPINNYFNQNQDKIYHLGESHCLSFAHNNINIGQKKFSISPKIIFGGKAFHFCGDKLNIYKALAKYNIDLMPENSNIFIFFGEIDCRHDQGFILASEKTEKTTKHIIEKTVEGYISWFKNNEKKHIFYFFNIPAPIYNFDINKSLNNKVADVVYTFNKHLEKILKKYSFKMIDVYTSTKNKEKFSNNSFHCDFCHLDNRIIKIIEEQLSS